MTWEFKTAIEAVRFMLLNRHKYAMRCETGSRNFPFRIIATCLKPRRD